MNMIREEYVEIDLSLNVGGRGYLVFIVPVWVNGCN